MELLKKKSYAKAYVEILEIINHMGTEYKNKVPSKLLTFFEENKDTQYIYKLDESYSNKRKFLLDETLALLAMLELKYWANDSEKELLKQALKKNEMNYQQELSEKYDSSDLFKKINQVKSEEADIENEVYITKYKESIFKKFINKLKKIFSIK